MEQLEEICCRLGWRILHNDIPYKALIFEFDGVIIINPALMTDKAANNMTAWVIENPFDHNHAN